MFREKEIKTALKVSVGKVAAITLFSARELNGRAEILVNNEYESRDRIAVECNLQVDIELICDCGDTNYHLNQQFLNEMLFQLML